LPLQEAATRVWAYFRAHVAWIMAAVNVLAQWTLAVDALVTFTMFAVTIEPSTAAVVAQ